MRVRPRGPSGVVECSKTNVFGRDMHTFKVNVDAGACFPDDVSGAINGSTSGVSPGGSSIDRRVR
eukprot:10486200-Lingulodinium_polyedra.AAC.1